MRNYFPIIFSFVLGILLAMGAKKLLHLYIDRFFGKKMNLIEFKYVILFFTLFAVLWTYGKYIESNWLLMAGASMMAILNIFSLVLIIFLPWPLIFFSVTDRINRKKSTPPVVNFERRHFIKVAASALPVMALGTAGSGMAGSFQPVGINKVPMYFKNLPIQLDGFKILHLSDLHLGYYFHLSDLEETMQWQKSLLRIWYWLPEMWQMI